MYTSVVDLIFAVNEFIDMYNEIYKPFVRAAKIDDILRNVSKC